jgi:predicted metal-binding protein
MLNSIMVKFTKSVQTMPAPVDRAMVFICEKCSKRVGGEAKHASHKLASKLKRLAKHELGKGEIRVALTSCMDACPEERIAISVQPVNLRVAPMFLEADPRDIEASSAALLKILRQSG